MLEFFISPIKWQMQSFAHELRYAFRNLYQACAVLIRIRLTSTSCVLCPLRNSLNPLDVVEENSLDALKPFAGISNLSRLEKVFTQCRSRLEWSPFPVHRGLD